MKHDVIIVGAGPAGSTCARYIARSGLNVIIIDKDQFPRDKPCGGGFSYEILNRFPYLRKREDEFLDAILKVGVIHSPNRAITLKGQVEMAVALRTKLDYALLKEAIDAGATTQFGHRVKELTITDNKVRIGLSNNTELTASVLVGADGVTSFIARQSNLHRRWTTDQVTVCRVVEIPVKTTQIEDVYGSEKEYHFYVNFNQEPGYGWIFPKSRTINVGLGVVGSHSSGLPRKFRSFISFLKREGKIPSDSNLSQTKGALVPTAGTIEKTYTDKVLLVGDSAGMVSPITGGGIDYAMRAARIAAAVIIKNSETESFNEDSLSVYQRLWQTDFGHEIRPQLFAQKIFTSNLTDTLFEIGRRDPKIQQIVTDTMSESNKDGPNIKQLLFRTLVVCIKGALHI